MHVFLSMRNEFVVKSISVIQSFHVNIFSTSVEDISRVRKSYKPLNLVLEGT